MGELLQHGGRRNADVHLGLDLIQDELDDIPDVVVGCGLQGEPLIVTRRPHSDDGKREEDRLSRIDLYLKQRRRLIGHESSEPMGRQFARRVVDLRQGPQWVARQHPVDHHDVPTARVLGDVVTQPKLLYGLVERQSEFVVDRIARVNGVVVPVEHQQPDPEFVAAQLQPRMRPSDDGHTVGRTLLTQLSEVAQHGRAACRHLAGEFVADHRTIGPQQPGERVPRPRPRIIE